MRNKSIHGLLIGIAFAMTFASAGCGLFDSKHAPDGGGGGLRFDAGGTGGTGGCALGGSGYGQTGCTDAAVVACDGVLFDNGNTAACTSPTNTSVFTLATASMVTTLRLWTNTTISGQTVTYTLLGPTGATMSSGPTTKGGCDPYQTNWCEFMVNLNMTLSAGTYTVRSSAAATCANAGSNSVGMVLVRGCAAAAPASDAAIADTGVDTAATACNTVLFDNGNIAACTLPTDTSVFTLAGDATVTSLRLWTNTAISGQTVTYALLGPTGATLSSGPTTKGGCDPYQTNWCEFLVSLNLTLPAGTYTVKSSAVATCANSGSNNVGMVLVKGCAGTAPVVDAGCPYGGAKYGGGCADAPPATCNTVLFDNGNIAACTLPTDTSVFTLAGTSTVTSLRLWTNTTISGQTVTYALLGPTGATLSSGPTTKGGCDPYQTNWCEFLVSLNLTLPAGTYTVKSSAVATCANSGSNNVGMVLVKGCTGTVTLPDAGAPDAAATTAACNLIVNGNAEAAAGSTDGTPLPTPGWASVGQATAAQYGVYGWPAATDPGPTDRGVNLFSGGPADATSSLAQTVNLGSYATSIDGGGVSYQLSGWLGGYAGQDDYATLTLTFQNTAGAALGTATIGPVYASERASISGLLLRSATGLVPVGTRSAGVTLTMVRMSGTANDGYADNLSLVLSGTGIPVCPGNATGDGGVADARPDAGTADATPAYFVVSTPPAGLTAPAGAKVSALKTTTLGVGGLFWKDGRLFVPSNSGGPIVSVMPGETGTLWANVPGLAGGTPSWRHGVPLPSGNVLLAVDYYGGPTGLHEITPAGGDTAWTLAQGHAGIGDIVALASGWAFSDFESYNLFKVAAQGAAETAAITVSSPTYTPGYLAYDATIDALYFVNLNNLGSEPWFAGDGGIYKLGAGAPTLVASAPTTTSRFAGLAIGLGGLFPAGLYAADSANSRIVRVESTGALTAVVTGVPTPSEIRIDPVSKGMALLSADQVLFILP
jgi:hypothetical protein